jgi:hypothetical protein
VERRRLLILGAVVAAGLVLLLLGRPGAGDPEPPAASGPPATPALADPAGVPAPPAATAPATTAPATTGPATPAPAATGPPAAIEDGGVAGAEELEPAELPAAVAAAERFAAIWATPDPDWHARLAELATPELAAALAAADPPQPARELIGAGQVYFDAPQWARIGVPAVRGTVVLDVVAADGRWLVSAVDWWPA